jgi:hypothetical protein
MSPLMSLHYGVDKALSSEPMRHCLVSQATGNLYAFSALLQDCPLTLLFLLKYCHDTADDAGIPVTIINRYLLIVLKGLELTNGYCGVA